MKRLLIFFVMVAMTTGVAAQDGPSSSTPTLRFAEPAAVPHDLLQAIGDHRGSDSLHGKGGPTCVPANMACNSTVNGNLTNQDCVVDDGIFADFWVFQGTAGETVTINLSSNQFDTIAFLLDPTPEVVAVDDDGGPGTNSRIIHNLDSTGNWAIAAVNFAANELGAYTLQLECNAAGGPVPAAPSNLDANAIATDEVELNWNDNSNNETEFRVEVRPPAGNFVDIGSVPDNTTAVNVIGLDPNTTYDFRVRARNANGNSPYSNVASATTFPLDGDCVEDAETICLNDDRFEVKVDWSSPDFPERPALVSNLRTDDSGVFYFLDPDNLEFLIKVLTGCDFNDHFWVFFAATTNVEFEVTVTDTDTGDVQRYTNPFGQPADAVTDTQAFATCP